MSIKNIQGGTSYQPTKNQEYYKLEQEKLSKEVIERSKIEDKKKNLQDTEEKKQSLLEVTKGLNEMVKIFNRKLDFEVHEETHRLMVKVVNTEDGKVVREIPPEEILDLAAKMKEAFSIFIDVRV